MQLPLSCVPGNAATNKPPAPAQLQLQEHTLSHAVHVVGNQRLPTVWGVLDSAKDEFDQHAAASICGLGAVACMD